MRHSVAFLVVAALALSGCGIGADQTTPEGIDGSWQLVSGTYQGSPIQLIDSHPVTLTIDGRSVGGTAACNSYGGEWTLDGSTASFADLSQTEMACQPDTTMNLERIYLDGLLAVTKVAIANDQLFLSGPEVELRFNAVDPPPTTDLLGTVWKLESLIQGDAMTSVSGDPTLEFFTDGSFIATTGCRNVTGNYVESGPDIVVTSMVAQGECNPELEAQDSHIITVLEGGYRVAIDGPNMTLTIAGDEGLAYRTVPQY